MAYVDFAAMKAAVPLAQLPDGTLAGYQGLAASGDQAPAILFVKNLDQCTPTPAPRATGKKLLGAV